MSEPAAPLRLGLVGAGPWGRNVIRTVAALDGVRLRRLASRNPESAGLVGAECAITDDWRQLIAAGDLDGLVLAVPATLHAEMTLAAIERDLPVLVEKPMTMAVADAETVLARAEARGAIVRVDHIHLYSAAWQTLRLEAATLGPLRAIAGKGGRWGVFRPDCPVLWDWGSHYVAMCVDLAGRPPDGAACRRLEARDTGDGRGEVLALSLDFGGVAAEIVIGNLFDDKHRRLDAVFANGRLRYDDVAEVKLRRWDGPGGGGDDGDESGDGGNSGESGDGGAAVPVGPGTPLERAIHSFADAVRNGTADTADAALGAAVVRVLARLEASLA